MQCIGQIFLLLVVVQPEVLAPRLRRQDAVVERDPIDLRLLQLIAYVQRRRNDLQMNELVQRCAATLPAATALSITRRITALSCSIMLGLQAARTSSWPVLRRPASRRSSQFDASDVNMNSGITSRAAMARSSACNTATKLDASRIRAGKSYSMPAGTSRIVPGPY